MWKLTIKNWISVASVLSHMKYLVVKTLAGNLTLAGKFRTLAGKYQLVF